MCRDVSCLTAWSLSPVSNPAGTSLDLYMLLALIYLSGFKFSLCFKHPSIFRTLPPVETFFFLNNCFLKICYTCVYTYICIRVCIYTYAHTYKNPYFFLHDLVNRKQRANVPTMSLSLMWHCPSLLFFLDPKNYHVKNPELACWSTNNHMDLSSEFMLAKLQVSERTQPRWAS